MLTRCIDAPHTGTTVRVSIGNNICENLTPAFQLRMLLSPVDARRAHFGIDPYAATAVANTRTCRCRYEEAKDLLDVCSLEPGLGTGGCKYISSLELRCKVVLLGLIP